jgi:bifunctional non-homologous end joining protein LigD
MPALAEKPARGERKVRASPRRASNGQELKFGDKHVPVSNLEKVLYPKVRFTKSDVINYYIRVSKFILPHLKGRPITLKRYPNGVEAEFFYEKRCPPYRPKWIKTAPVWSEGHQADIHFCVMDDLPSLVWAANLADIEIHTYMARAAKIDCPTMIVFDLDPGTPADILQCCEVAFLLKAKLDKLKLQSFPKTSGSKGLQLYVPLNTPTSYDATKPFAKALAESLTREHPELIVARMEKALRAGKIFVDWSQNDRHKTTVCVYSLRAKDRPTVSTPVTWDELRTALKQHSVEKLTFDSEAALHRAEKLGDLFEPVLKLKQKMPKPEVIESL